MSNYGGTDPTTTTTTTPGVCNVNDYLKTINAILVQLLDKKDKKQTLERLANLKEEIVATLRADEG
jgi:hypothetical protein